MRLAHDLPNLLNAHEASPLLEPWLNSHHLTSEPPRTHQTPQAHSGLQERHEGATTPAISRLAEGLQRLGARQSEAAAKMGAEAAETRGQLEELLAWFDSNQARALALARGLAGRARGFYPHPP